MLDYGYGVVLDTIDPEYSETLRCWRNDSELRQWFRQHNLISAQDQDEWMIYQNDSPDISMFVIIAGEDIVGVCGLTDINLIHRRAEFSLYIAPEHQRKGFGLAALKSLFHHGFDDFGLNSIWGELFSGNPAADMLKKVGMAPDGVHREHYFKGGTYFDADIYSILADEFVAKYKINVNSRH